MDTCLYPVPVRYPATFHYPVPVPDSQETRTWNRIILLTFYFVDYSLVILCKQTTKVRFLRKHVVNLSLMTTSENNLSTSNSTSGSAQKRSGIRQFSTQLNCQCALRSLCQYPVSGKFLFWLDSRFNYPATICFWLDSENPYPAHTYQARDLLAHCAFDTQSLHCVTAKPRFGSPPHYSLPPITMNTTCAPQGICWNTSGQIRYTQA